MIFDQSNYSWFLMTTQQIYCKISFVIIMFLSLQEWSLIYYEEESPGVYPFDYLQYSLVSRGFPVRLEYPFFIFFYSPFTGVSFQFSQVFVGFLFLRAFRSFLHLSFLFLLLCVVSRFSLLAWCSFPYGIQSRYPYDLFSLPVLGFPNHSQFL